jgi:rRNA-processing protein FCF1
LTRILCDTSFLIILASRPVKMLDAVERGLGKLELVVPSVVIEELKRLARDASTKRSDAARLALEAAKNFQVIPLAGANADDAIIDYASEHKYYVATVDGGMKERLKRNKIGIITLSQDRAVVA